MTASATQLHDGPANGSQTSPPRVDPKAPSDEAGSPGWVRRLAIATLLTGLAAGVTVLSLPTDSLPPGGPSAVTWRQWTGYSLLALMVAGVAFGALRRGRWPALSHAGWLNMHQALGLVMLVGLALHAGGRPAGWLLVLFVLLLGMSAAGAARSLINPLRRPGLVRSLLATHIALACTAVALVTGHLIFVFAYTA
jgi:hypothetical protein